MRIPAPVAEGAVGPAPETPPAQADKPHEPPENAPFRLSPPESRPRRHVEPPIAAEPVHANEPGTPQAPVPHGSVFRLESPLPAANENHTGDPHVGFELLDDDSDPASLVPVSPAIERGLREIAEFEKDRSGYAVADEKRGFFFRLENSKPSGWFYVKWRAAVGSVLKVLRWIDAWAYLISVPFIILMIFGIVVEHRAFVHTGGVVVVLANYGRFWADLIAFFLRPYKDGPLQGVAFLFPPYTVYYLTVHWKHMKPILRRIATSCIPIVLVVLAYAFLPSVNPGISHVKGITAKIEAGKEKLRQDVASDLEKVEDEVRTLGHANEPAPKSKN